MFFVSLQDLFVGLVFLALVLCSHLSDVLYSTLHVPLVFNIYYVVYPMLKKKKKKGPWLWIFYLEYLLKMAQSVFIWCNKYCLLCNMDMIPFLLQVQVVLSLLPPSFHTTVANACIEVFDSFFFSHSTSFSSTVANELMYCMILYFYIPCLVLNQQVKKNRLLRDRWGSLFSSIIWSRFNFLN